MNKSGNFLFIERRLDRFLFIASPKKESNACDAEIKQEIGSDLVITIEDCSTVSTEKMKEESTESKSIAERGFLVGPDGDSIKSDFKVIFHGSSDCEESTEFPLEGKGTSTLINFNSGSNKQDLLCSDSGESIVHVVASKCSEKDGEDTKVCSDDDPVSSNMNSDNISENEYHETLDCSDRISGSNVKVFHSVCDDEDEKQDPRYPSSIECSDQSGTDAPTENLHGTVTRVVRVNYFQVQ